MDALRSLDVDTITRPILHPNIENYLLNKFGFSENINLTKRTDEFRECSQFVLQNLNERDNFEENTFK